MMTIGDLLNVPLADFAFYAGAALVGQFGVILIFDVIDDLF